MNYQVLKKKECQLKLNLPKMEPSLTVDEFINYLEQESPDVLSSIFPLYSKNNRRVVDTLNTRDTTLLIQQISNWRWHQFLG